MTVIMAQLDLWDSPLCREWWIRKYVQSDRRKEASKMFLFDLFHIYVDPEPINKFHEKYCV